MRLMNSGNCRVAGGAHARMLPLGFYLPVAAEGRNRPHAVLSVTPVPEGTKVGASVSARPFLSDQ